VSQSAHSMDQVHGLLGLQERGDSTGDEQTDHLALERFHLFTSDGELRRDAHELQSALDRVVVGEGQAIEAALLRANDQLLEGALAVVGEVRMKMQVDADHGSRYSAA